MSPSLVSPSPSSRVHVLEVLGNGIVGGMETYVARLVEGLPGRSFAVTAIVPYECAVADRLRAAGADVVVIPVPEDPLWSSIQAACALVRAAGVDVLHAHLPNAHVLAGLVGHLSGKPVVSTIHGRQIQGSDLEVHRMAGTHLSVVCRHSYYHALGLGADPRLLTCIPNGVDTRAFHPGVEPERRLHRELALPDDAPLVGFVGRLSPEKGPEVFVRAVALLGAQAPAARFVVCGDGPQRESLNALAARLDVGGRLHFLGERDDMPALYRELDLVVSTSYSEALPLALMEAMASGLPVIATRVGGVPELVEHGGTGWLVAPRDHEGVAHIVARLLCDPAERRRLGERGRERVAQRFDLDECITRTGELLVRLATRPAIASRGSGLGGST